MLRARARQVSDRRRKGSHLRRIGGSGGLAVQLPGQLRQLGPALLSGGSLGARQGAPGRGHPRRREAVAALELVQVGARHDEASSRLVDLADYLSNGIALPDKPIVLTFDDGYTDNYANAFPVLHNHKFTGTFFVITQFVNENRWGYMSWAQLDEMAKAGMEIGSHSLDHPELRGKSRAFQFHQLVDSKQMIETRLGTSVWSFAYPAGKYDANTISVLGSGGYLSAVTEIQGTNQQCPTGEAYAKQQIAEKRLPVLSCEGPCIRGDIARLAANLVAREVPNLARACHGEVFYVPQSSIAGWVKEAAKTVMIDGCFLQCHGRALKGLIGEEKVVEIDALPFHGKYGDLFSMDDVPEQELKAVARQVADEIIATLTHPGAVAGGASRKK